jgi:beta-mannosidase
MDTICLDGVWSVRPELPQFAGETGLAQVIQHAEGWLPALVPGEIHLDLIRAGQMPEPTVGMNMPECRWPETKAWWYRRTFDVPAEFLTHDRQQLVCDGLDLYAQVFANGALVGEARNAFVPAVFDVKAHLRAGENELIVRLTAGSELAKDAVAPPMMNKALKPEGVDPGEIPNPMQPGDLKGHRTWPGRKWLRKPQFSYGWDWVDALPNIGLWRGVRVEGRSAAALHDLRLDTRLDGEHARLELAATVENLRGAGVPATTLMVEITPPGGGAVLGREYAVKHGEIADLIEVPDPQLWWPNGMGEQPLYAVRAELRDAAGAVCDRREFSIGLRTVAIDQAPLPEGRRFGVRVNGQAVFCHGVNIGPHDAILARISDAKYEALVAEARNANINMIRINGCSIYEAQAFYDACDRAGILIWHDFMFTATHYPEDDPEYRANVANEIDAVVRALRHHPSIALWCGDNETDWFIARWSLTPAETLPARQRRFYASLIPDRCRQLDPRRPYWISSPTGGDYPNSELEGDNHWWLLSFMHPDLHRRITHEGFDECRARFVSEYGFIGPCHLDSMRAFLSPEDLRPGSAAWEMHTNVFEKKTVPAGIRRHYAEPDGLPVERYVLYGQMVQAYLHGHAMEALRFRKGDPVDDCQGGLIWSYSECWGESGWSILDYYLRRKASYYWFRRACAPVKVIVRRRFEHLVTRVVNDTLAAVTGEVEVGWWAVDGHARETHRYPLAVPPNGMASVTAEALPGDTERDPNRWIYAAVWREADGTARDQSIWTLRPHRELALSAPILKVTALPAGEVEVVSGVYSHGVHLEDHGREVVSDNYFDLLPGVAVRVRVAAGAVVTARDFSAV